MTMTKAQLAWWASRNEDELTARRRDLEHRDLILWTLSVFGVFVFVIVLATW